MLALIPLPTRREAFQALKAGLQAPLVAADGTVVSSGFPELDEALGGGFPRGTIASLEGPASSGRMAIAARMLATASQTGLVAAIDDRSLYPPDLALAGVRLERLLVVSVKAELEIPRAADIVLRSQAFEVLLIPALRFKAAVWSRLATIAHRANVLLVTLGGDASSELAYFASTRVGCSIERVLWTNASGLFCELAGYEIHTQTLKHKRSAPGKHARFVVRHGAVACGNLLLTQSLVVNSCCYA